MSSELKETSDLAELEARDYDQSRSHSTSRSRSRTGRSFSRTLQTRVTPSRSPDPTLVGGSNSRGSRRRRSASRGRSRTPAGLSSSTEEVKDNEIRNRDASGSSSPSNGAIRGGIRWRSASRTLTNVSPPSKPTDESKANFLSWPPPLVSGKEHLAPHADSEAKSKEAIIDLEKAQEGKGQPQGQTSWALCVLPHPIPHFFGYRRPPHLLSDKVKHIKPHPPLLSFLRYLPPMWEFVIWAWIGGFVGIAIVELVFTRPTHFASSIDQPPHAWASPVIVGSFGASSVLLFSAPASPLAQPRPFIGGQFLSSLTGVVVAKLVALSSRFDLQLTDRSGSLVWLAGSIAVGSALSVMLMTGTLHPPGGATALLCTTNKEVLQLGWKAIPVTLLSSVLMFVWALIWMNLGRTRYPHAGYLDPNPPYPREGNASQWIFIWVQNQYKKRLHSAQAESDVQKQEGVEQRLQKEEEKRGPGSDPPVPTSSLNKADQRNGPNTTTIHSSTISKALEKQLVDERDGETGPWKDESPWAAIGGTVQEGGEEEDEEKAERPSRWFHARSRN